MPAPGHKKLRATGDNAVIWCQSSMASWLLCGHMTWGKTNYNTAVRHGITQAQGGGDRYCYPARPFTGLSIS